MQRILSLFIRYLSAGAIATLVHYAVFVCLLTWFAPTPSTFVAASTGALVAFCLSRLWVFAQRSCNKLRFFMTATGQVLTNTLMVNLLVFWGIPPLLAQVLATAAVTLQGFTINHFWVFKHDLHRKPFQ
ncbi:MULTISPECIES: GtrA family protein [Pseudomonas]|uniref:GtrA family protein n=1 Tax=Pseudomonas reactans TaxID=117680 RepID=A0A7Y8G030_9PSED|nr:GtrA family protein [Pseudomonas reactans]NWD79074.1 GtrA family protein [Pseudomonas reactans]NWE88565.1 GtrA family protein [Pseudomonas reactans]